MSGTGSEPTNLTAPSPGRRGKRSKIAPPGAATAADIDTTVTGDLVEAAAPKPPGSKVAKATGASDAASSSRNKAGGKKKPPEEVDDKETPTLKLKDPPPPSAASAAAYAAAVALPPQALYGYPAGTTGTAADVQAAAAAKPSAPEAAATAASGVVYSDSNKFAHTMPEPKAASLTAAMRAAYEIEQHNNSKLVFDETGNVNVQLKLPRRKSGDDVVGDSTSAAADAAEASTAAAEIAAAEATVDEASGIGVIMGSAAATAAAAAAAAASMAASVVTGMIKPTASMGSMQTTLNLVHSQNPGLLKQHQGAAGATAASGGLSSAVLTRRFGGGAAASVSAATPFSPGSDGGDPSGSHDDGMGGQSLRVLKRLVPKEAEATLREQVLQEYANVLVCEECLEESQALGVSSQAAKFNRVFEDRFFELLVFAKAYGHMHVPKLYPDNPPLGRWVVKVRSWKKKNDPRLTPSRLRRLDEVGFIWEPKNHQDFWKVQGSNRKAEDLWETNFAELLLYKDEYGTCLVPKEFKPNQRLARWVTKQRKHHKAKSEGRYHSLDDDKERRLIDVGFVFNTKTKELMRDSVLRRYEDRWEEFCEKLAEFKREFGHTAVPRRWKRDPQLASWVMRQRFQWRKMQYGEHSYLTKARLERLEEIGFVFGEIDRKNYPVGKIEEGEDDSVDLDEDALDADDEDAAGDGDDGDKKPAATKVSRSAAKATTKRPPKRPMTKAKPKIASKGTRKVPGRQASAKKPLYDEEAVIDDTNAEDGKPAAIMEAEVQEPATVEEVNKEAEGKAAEEPAAEESPEASAAATEVAPTEADVTAAPEEATKPDEDLAGEPAAAAAAEKDEEEPPEESFAHFVATCYEEAVGKGLEIIAIREADQLE